MKLLHRRNIVHIFQISLQREEKNQEQNEELILGRRRRKAPADKSMFHSEKKSPYSGRRGEPWRKRETAMRKCISWVAWSVKTLHLSYHAEDEAIKRGGTSASSFIIHLIRIEHRCVCPRRISGKPRLLVDKERKQHKKHQTRCRTLTVTLPCHVMSNVFYCTLLFSIHLPLCCLTYYIKKF